MKTEPVWITETDLVELLDMEDAIAALEAGLYAEARGDAQNMTKTHVAWPVLSAVEGPALSAVEGPPPHGTLHAIGAAFSKAGFVGTKTWAHTPGGATPLVILFDSRDGSLRAIIEAFALGQLRTGAASGVATRRLADDKADTLAIVGTGKQALPQVAAVAAVRPLRQVRVFGRDPGRRAAFASRVAAELGVRATAEESVADAVRDAPLITLATRATEPFLTAEMVAPGAHINAVGAIVPSGAEIATDVLARCGEIVADSPTSARRLSRELIGFLGDSDAAWGRVRSLAGLVAAGPCVADRAARPAGRDLSVFKSLGTGIADLSVGIEVYRRALEAGRGRPVPRPVRAAPQLTRRVKTEL